MEPKAFVDAGITDPTIFELAELFESGIGADRISDMTVAIIRPFLWNFSAAAARTLQLPTVKCSFRDKDYLLPRSPLTGRHLTFVPEPLLTKLPLAYDCQDIDAVCAHNAALRARVNALIRPALSKARRLSKSQFKDLLLADPKFAAQILKFYKEASPSPYDFAGDPEAEFRWHEAAGDYSANHPLDLSAFTHLTPASLFLLVERICKQYRSLITDNGLWEILYHRGNLNHERVPQRLFHGIASAYCTANNIDLSPESNAGRGAVDFKLSRGQTAKVTVEVKYSSNKQLHHGWQKQLPEYNKAERTSHSIYLILKVTNTPTAIRRILAEQADAVRARRRVPAVIVIDARPQRSASKA